MADQYGCEPRDTVRRAVRQAENALLSVNEAVAILSAYDCQHYLLEVQAELKDRLRLMRRDADLPNEEK